MPALPQTTAAVSSFARSEVIAVVFVSRNPCVVTIRVLPGGDTVWIRLVGAVEIGAEPALGQAVKRVRDVAPGIVLVDLGGVTFAGSALVHFLIHVHAAARDARICLCRATRSVAAVVRATGIDAFVCLDEGLPDRLSR